MSMIRLTALLLAVTAPVFAPASPPRCIDDLTRAESGARAHVAAPIVAPLRGGPGTPVTIRGGGYPARTRLVIAAVYGDNQCVIEGLGDQYLGAARADGRGSYSIRVRWPHMFDPVLGRNGFQPRPLPSGKYYVFVLPCAARAACSFVEGTSPAGPFVLGAARASPVVWITTGSVIALALLGGLLITRRKTR